MILIIVGEVLRTSALDTEYFSRYNDELLAGWPEFNYRQAQEIFHFSTASIPSLGPTQALIQWVAEALSLEVKWPGRWANHSPQE